MDYILGILGAVFLIWLIWFEYHDKQKHEKAYKQIKSMMSGDNKMLKQCPNCKKVYGESDNYCLSCNYPLQNVDTSTLTDDEVKNVLRHEKAVNNPSKLTLNSNNNQVKCPRCGSTQIQIVKRGWKLTSGFIGSSKNERVCTNCMKKF